MNSVNEYVSEIIKTIKKDVPVTVENVIGMFCMCFAGYCKVSEEEIKKFGEIKNILRRKGCPQSVVAAYEVLEKYTAETEIMSNFLKKVNFKYVVEQRWRSMGEGLIFHIASDKSMEGIEENAAFLNKLCMYLLSPKEGDFYDGASGMGSALICAKQHSVRLKFFGQEINPVYHAISVLRAYMHGIDTDNICCGDTLKNPAFSDGDSLKKFDYSVIFPPFGTSLRYFENVIYNDIYGRFSGRMHPNTPCEWLFIRHMTASLSEGGRAVAIVPSGALFNDVAKDVREGIISEGIIESIISLPQNILSASAMPLNLIVINKGARPDADILFVRGENYFEQYKTDYKNPSVEIIFDIVNCCRDRENIVGVSRLISCGRLENAVLLPSRYVEKPILSEEFGALFIREPREGDWCTLKDAGELYRGINISASSKSSNLDEYKIINYTDIQNGELCTDKVASYYISSGTRIKKYAVRAGDLLISCKGTAIKICAVPKHDEILLMSANFLGIHVDANKFDVRFLKCYLESPAGRQFLTRRQVGTSIRTLAARDLEEIPVPNIGVERQREYVSQFLKKEEELKVEIAKLKNKINEEKWNFYTKIGLGNIMEKM